MHTPQALSWDIFCRVVDNFGDAGICWRLARQLAIEHGEHVRLWIDDLESLRRLSPEIARAERQVVDRVDLRHWRDGAPPEAPAQIVIEAFGCGLSDEYVRAMAHAAPRPLWIVLEYLSAEPWVSRHHGLPSPHPRWPPERYFIFPGFVSGTGGLIRERDLFARRDRFGPHDAEAFWRSLGHEPVPPGALAVSVFAYSSAPLAELLPVWESADSQTVCAIPEAPGIDRLLGCPPGQRPTRAVRRGSLEVRIVPFLPQSRYDELLWACNCNFVRGEDSFLRAQWAARPMIWQVYPQEQGAHYRKLDAFLALYAADLPGPARQAAVGMMHAWNQCGDAAVRTPAAWAAFAAELQMLQRHGRSWAERLAGMNDLAGELARFCRERLK